MTYFYPFIPYEYDNIYFEDMEYNNIYETENKNHYRENSDYPPPPKFCKCKIYFIKTKDRQFIFRCRYEEENHYDGEVWHTGKWEWRYKRIYKPDILRSECFCHYCD